MANIDKIRAALEGKILASGGLVKQDPDGPPRCALGELLSVAGVSDEQMLTRQHDTLTYAGAFPELAEVYGLNSDEVHLIWLENDATEDPAGRAKAVIHTLEVRANG